MGAVAAAASHSRHRGCRARGNTYVRRCPEERVLYGVIQQELETFLARARPVPRFVERELRSFLGCGILAHGFVREHVAAWSSYLTVSMFTSGDLTRSNYHVVFDLAAPTPFVFEVVNLEPRTCSGGGMFPTNAPSGSVTLDAVDPANPSTVIGSLYSVSLSRNQVDPLCGEGYPGLSVEGTLEPGAYASTSSSATGLLVAFGVLGLAIRGRVRA